MTYIKIKLNDLLGGGADYQTQCLTHAANKIGLTANVVEENRVKPQREMTAKELIDIIQPKHGRTSCSDDNVANGLWSSSHFTRCTRCALLDILSYGFKPDSHTLESDFKIDPKLAEAEEDARD